MKYSQNTKNYMSKVRSKKLQYIDQFVDDLSLSRALTEVSTFDVGFDSWDMYDSDTGKTILEASLNGTKSFRQLINIIKEYMYTPRV
jgi:hypothetical protein